MGEVLHRGCRRGRPLSLDVDLAYYLNYDVLPSPPEDAIHPFVFPVAMSLAQGKKLALVPWYLGFFYARLDKCLRNTTCSAGRYDVVCYIDANFL